MTKQFTFEQRFRQRRAVDFNERPLCPPRIVVNRSGNQLFPGAAFTANQDAGLRKGNFGGVFADVHHRRAVGENVPHCQLVLSAVQMTDLFFIDWSCKAR